MKDNFYIILLVFVKPHHESAIGMLFMSTNGNLEDLKLLRIQVMEDVGADDQIWIYQEGCIKCRVSFGVRPGSVRASLFK